MPGSAGARPDVGIFGEASAATFKATGLTPPATIWILQKIFRYSRGGAPGRLFGEPISSEQQHSEDWLIVQYFRTVVTPIEDAHMTTRRPKRTAICEMPALIA